MSEDIPGSLPDLVAKDVWRGAVQAVPDFKTHVILVSMLLVDHWAPTGRAPICARIDQIVHESRLSQATVYRAFAILAADGFLVQMRPASHRQPAGWRPTLPDQADLVRAHVESQLAPRPGLIYYLRIGAHVKIGYTTDLSQRLAAYPPDAAVLASHPGTPLDEFAIHEEMRQFLAARREWYRAEPELLARIAALPSASAA